MKILIMSSVFPSILVLDVGKFVVLLTLNQFIMKKIILLFTVFFSLLSYSQNGREISNTNYIEIKLDSLKVNSDSKKEKNSGDDPEFLFTNAVNFDFGNTTKSSTAYFGHLNYFFNVKNSDNLIKFYVNTGLIKVNYYSSEINKRTIFQDDNVLENPLNSTEPGQNYVKQFNKYDYDTKLSSYCGYVQLLRKIGKKYNILFCHLHGELLVTNVNTNITITNIAKENAVIPSNNIIPITNFLENEKSISTQNIGAFIGTGLTAKISFKKNPDDGSFINYFMQGTVGYSNTKLNPNLNNKQNNQPPSYEVNKSSSPFFLIHSYFENNITGANIIIGSQIRGNFTNAPFYTFYIGLNLNLENFKKLLQ